MATRTEDRAAHAEDRYPKIHVGHVLVCGVGLAAAGILPWVEDLKQVSRDEFTLYLILAAMLVALIDLVFRSQGAGHKLGEWPLALSVAFLLSSFGLISARTQTTVFFDPKSNEPRDQYLFPVAAIGIALLLAAFLLSKRGRRRTALLTAVLAVGFVVWQAILVLS